MKKDAKIFVAGHKGFVGSSIFRKLEKEGFTRIITRTRQELDLLNQDAVGNFFEQEQPEYVFLAAAKAGGIWANDSYPPHFIYENLGIQTNVIHQSYLSKVRRLLFLGSACIYPRDCPQPIKEEYMLTGPLEPTNDAYSVAKIAGLKMCQAYNRQYGTQFLSVMPINLYGPNDNFDLETSHVIPALIRKFYQAQRDHLPTVPVWGTGKPRREFLYVDDLAEACVFLLSLSDEQYGQLLQDDPPALINIGYGKDMSIRELAELISRIVGYEGVITWDSSRPDGTPQKLLDVTKLGKLGWNAKFGLQEGLGRTFDYFKENVYASPNINMKQHVVAKK